MVDINVRNNRHLLRKLFACTVSKLLLTITILGLFRSVFDFEAIARVVTRKWWGLMQAPKVVVSNVHSISHNKTESMHHETNPSLLIILTSLWH